MQLQIEGSLIRLVIVTNITPEMRFYAEESFGPEVIVTAFISDEECFRLTSDIQYSLFMAMFTQNVNHGIVLAKGIERDICYINRPTVYDEG